MPIIELGHVALSPVRIILINGPDRSGKDTLARLLSVSLERQGEIVEIVRLADPLKAAAAALHGLPIDFVLDERKEEPLDELNGKSPREVWVSLAEECVKPCWGPEFFAKTAKNVICRSAAAAKAGRPRTFIVPDVRFADETETLTGIPGSSTLLIRLASAGTDFTRRNEMYQDIEGTEGCFFVIREGDNYRVLRQLMRHVDGGLPRMSSEFTSADARR
jgi:hypothetical protein